MGIATADVKSDLFECDCHHKCPIKLENARLHRDASYWEGLYRNAQRIRNGLESKIKELEAKIDNFKRRLFGKQAEHKEISERSEKTHKKRKRGQQRGASGHGRELQKNLPIVEEEYDLDEDKKRCKSCGLRFAEFLKPEESEVIEIEVKAHRRQIKRKKYKKGCRCSGGTSIVTARGPGKLIPKGYFGVSFWVDVILEKFLWQRPLNRVLQKYEAMGLRVSSGTVTGGLNRIMQLFELLEKAIVEKNRSEHHWHADETQFMVFEKVKEKANHRWWLWVFEGSTTVVFLLKPTRGGQVVRDHMGDRAYGIISADRLSAYKTMLSCGRFLIAFCWAHVRRDFVEVMRDYRRDAELREWAERWIDRIGQLFNFNKKRIAHHVGSREYEQWHSKVEGALTSIKEACEQELSDPKLRDLRKGILKSLKGHWSGLTLFLKHPWIPMDNNRAERRIRNPVLGRKNYRGCGSVWSAELLARFFTVLQTVILWGINPKLWLNDYLDACAKRNGKPPHHIDKYLPWNMSKKRLRKLGADPEKIPIRRPAPLLREIKCRSDTVVGNLVKKRLISSKGLSKKARKGLAMPSLSLSAIS